LAEVAQSTKSNKVQFENKISFIAKGVSMPKICGFLAFILFSFCSLAASASEIGRATIDGRTVIVDSNGTWTYADAIQSPQAAGLVCTNGSISKSKKLPISFCLEKPWVLDISPPGSMEFQVLNRDLDLYFGLITERTQMDMAGLRRAILYNAATASNISEQDVPIAKETKEMINGTEWNYIEYDIAIVGGKFRFGNYYVILGDRGVAQMAFWSNTTYFEENRPTMIAMMNKVLLEK
jgi:hypothetical protein